MSNEISISQGFSLVKGNQTFTINNKTTKHNVAGTPRRTSNTQDIGFSASEAITIGADMASAGWAVFTNLDSTNFVTVGINPGTYQPFLKILPGVTVICPLATLTNLHAKADTASVQLSYDIFEA